MKREIDGILTKISYGYLSLPFLIFCMSWLNNWSAALFSIIILVSFYFILKTVKNDRESSDGSSQTPQTINLDTNCYRFYNILFGHRFLYFSK